MHIINFYQKKKEEPLSTRMSACLEASFRVKQLDSSLFVDNK